jgi:pimeloyl-ACP methyl ester carboxylesterase
VVEVGGLDTRVMPRAEVIAVLLVDQPTSVAASPVAAFRVLADAIGADRAALAAVVTRVEDAPIPLDRITAPTLVLCGRDDPLAVRPEVLAAAIPQAQLLIVPGDHLTAVRHPDFAPAITTFTTPTPN